MNNGAEEVLGRKHMIAALIKLRKNGEITQSDLNEYITNWKIVKDRIEKSPRATSTSTSRTGRS